MVQGGSDRAPQGSRTVGRLSTAADPAHSTTFLGPFLISDLHFRLIMSHRTAVIGPYMPLTIDSIEIRNSI